MKQRTERQPRSQVAPPGTLVPAPIPALSWRGVLSPVQLVAVLIVSGAALFSPVNVLSSSSALSVFTTGVAELFPRIRDTAAATEYPEVALFVFSVMLVALPILAPICLWQAHVNYPIIFQRAVRLGFAKPKHIALALSALPLSLLGLGIVTMWPDDSGGLYDGFRDRSRLGLTILAATLTWLAPIAAGGFYANVRLVIDVYLRRRTADE